MTIWAIVPAAGVGRRMGPSDPASSPEQSIPKQYRQVNGQAVLSCTLNRLLAVTSIESVLVLLRADDEYWQTLPEAQLSRIRTGEGAAERYGSVLNGLHLLPARANDWVLVHDAVRPCVLVRDIENLVNTLTEHPVGGLLAAPVDNTIKRVAANSEIIETLDRSELWNALTPQMFRYGVLLSALESAMQNDFAVTDEASAVERAGFKPLVVPADKQNIKITHEGDLALSSLILKSQEQADV